MINIIMGSLTASDQAAALTGAAYLDHSLQLLLLASFRQLSREEAGRFFDASANAILGSMAAKARIAYATKLIPKAIYDDLSLIIHIRNVFAHTLHVVDFRNALIEEDCTKLKAVTGAFDDMMPPDAVVAKHRYFMAVITIYLELRKSIKRLSLAKALEEYGTPFMDGMADAIRGRDTHAPSPDKSVQRYPHKAHRRVRKGRQRQP